MLVPKDFAKTKFKNLRQAVLLTFESQRKLVRQL